MQVYSYKECLERSHRINWTIDEVVQGRRFDLKKPWLPETLSGGQYIDCLFTEEKKKLTHIEMGSYAHLFGYVEEFIAPKISELAQDFATENGITFQALSNFVAEEIKHMALFKRLRHSIDREIGFELQLIEDPKGTAGYVLSKNNGAVLLLTACIEWFTQRHYLDAFANRADLDEFTKHIFKCHWLEESQHAKMDHNETLRAFEKMSGKERDAAITDLIELVGSVDGLLQKQSAFDVDNLAVYLDRGFSEAERTEIYNGILKAKRYTFILSGVTHDKFAELFANVTNEKQRERVVKALSSLQ